MFLTNLTLSNFRSYQKKEFVFDKGITIIVGPNTAGKSNLIESIFLLATGGSFRIDKDIQMVRFGENIARVSGSIEENSDKQHLEVVFATGEVTGGRFLKKYLINNLSKKKADFSGILPTVLFSPEELDIVTLGPSYRRKFLNDILIQTNRDYRVALGLYEKALKQRNALLHQAKESGIKNKKQFEYWDTLLITQGKTLTEKRESLVEFINQETKEIFEFRTVYDKSIISEERLNEYSAAELASGITLVGPHRDDFFMQMKDLHGNMQEIRYFGSRGQQRLVILQLKMLQIVFMEKIFNKRPLLLLDDIFSELDHGHIGLVLAMIGKQQTIMTTTHKEFLSTVQLQENHSMVEL